MFYFMAYIRRYSQINSWLLCCVGTSPYPMFMPSAPSFSILNSYKKLVYSQNSPAFDHYDFLLPRDQIIGLLLDDSLDVEM